MHYLRFVVLVYVKYQKGIYRFKYIRVFAGQTKLTLRICNLFERSKIANLVKIVVWQRFQNLFHTGNSSGWELLTDLIYLKMALGCVQFQILLSLIGLIFKYIFSYTLPKSFFRSHHDLNTNPELIIFVSILYVSCVRSPHICIIFIMLIIIAVLMLCSVLISVLCCTIIYTYTLLQQH